MKKIISRLASYFFILIVLVEFSCEKKENDTPTFSYIVNYEFIKTIPVSSIVTTLSLLSIQYPEASSLQSSAQYDVQVYKLTYKTHYKTEEINVSGLICIPNANEAFPLISFQNGTNTLNANAASMNPNSILFLYLESFAGCGYVLVIPDYIGFGASSQFVHPYYVNEPTTNAVVDLMKATKEFLSSDLVDARLNNNNYLMGYSQGGWSTLCTFKRLEEGTDSIPVMAASCGAGAYNLINAADYIASQVTYTSPLYLPYYIYSHQQYGSISESLNLFFNEPYASRIPGLFDGLHDDFQINSQLNDTISSLLKPEFISALTNPNIGADNYANFRSDLINNSVSAWAINGNLHFYHGNADDQVPVTESRNIYQDFLQLNSSDKVEYFEMDGFNHSTGSIPWGVKTIKWFISLENSN